MNKDIDPLEKIAIEIDDFLKKSDNEICIVFDIGTNAIRALIGPILTYDEFKAWDPRRKNIFIQPVLHTKLGGEFNIHSSELDISISSGLNRICNFINLVLRKTAGRTRSNKNVVAVGTAVFRWIVNQDQVIRRIADLTGIQIQVVQPRTEAYLSLLAIVNTYNKSNSNDLGELDTISFGENDVILLIDQGGGSTEVSYFYPKSNKLGDLKSMYHIGTRNLESHFARKMGDREVNPLASGVNVIDAISEIKNFSSAEITHGLNSVIEDLINEEGENRKIWAYGMGTAIKACFERHYKITMDRYIPGVKFHGHILKTKQMLSVYDHVLADLTLLTPTIRDLYKRIDRLEKWDKGILEDDISMLYGLPTYNTILRKINVDAIRYAYYNLRYGVYIKRFVFGDENLGATEQFKPDSRSIKTSDESFKWDVFLCHSKSNELLVTEIKNALEKNGITAWIDDKEILAGDHILDKIDHGLKFSKTILVCISAEQLKSRWCNFEYKSILRRIIQSAKSMDKERKIISLIIDETPIEDVPDFLADCRMERYPSGLERVIHALSVLKN